jgi:ribosomal protein S18 acetylase RimI-like enzyme
MERVVVREATIADSDGIARLVSDLGYATSSSQMSVRLESIIRDEDYQTLVACDRDAIVGVVGTRIGPHYESDGLYGQIMALAVSRVRQRGGIGRMLMQAAETTLVRRGARVSVVTSGNHRTDAHAFYEKNGYAFTGRRFTKSLTLPR